MSEKKKTRGRPKLPDNEFRKVFTVRITEPEKARIKKAAKSAGKPVTQWAREALLEKAA